MSDPVSIRLLADGTPVQFGQVGGAGPRLTSVPSSASTTVPNTCHGDEIDAASVSRLLAAVDLNSMSVRGVPVVFESTVTDAELVAVAKEAMSSLLDDRDYLGYMVEHAKGRIDAETMEELTLERLRRESPNANALRRKVLALAALIGDRIDSETVSTALRCDLDHAREALAFWQPTTHG